MEYQHTPVMLKEVMDILQPRPGQNFIDCTLGGGGCTLAIARRILPNGKIISIDLDELAIDNLKFKILNLKLRNIIIAHDNFKNLQTIVKKYFKAGGKFAGIVFDLGLSSAQLACRIRGFSFQLADAPLAMNFGQEVNQTAADILNNWQAGDLARIFRESGEAKLAYKIAVAIVRQRQHEKIAKVGQLVKIITAVTSKKLLSGKLHPATKIFQALRLAVNDELENLRLALPQALALLAPGGKIAVLSYHSLEDRLVKRYFRQEAKDCLCPPQAPVCGCGHRARLKILTNKVLRPTKEEVLNNPRARSAKLRAVQKI